MKIELNGRKSYINFEYVDCETERYPSVCVAITVQDGDFRGYNNHKLMIFVQKLSYVT